MEHENSSAPRAEILSAFQSPTFDRDVEIRVDETIGSASISPSGRDVVLASREGLHIIDLDSPYSPPRHLAHYSPWEVADVQWSPFASRDYWIVSTSNQKALVWNLELRTAHAPIEHTLHAHSRAITDINFSAFNPDVLATCAVDSFVHCWDLRRPAKPVMTFADWNAGATHVKWNRQDPHIVASSHDRFLRIWDDRKGAFPLKSIEAHTTKIYGLDWNRTRSTGILTCSLDRTIKFWDHSSDSPEPERIVRTPFPVWRARHTPFGWGLLVMPQRGNFDLHLYDRRLREDTPKDGYVQPVYSFQGHHDQVKEFLWRSRGAVENGIDNRDFQLISWGVDKALRLHRVDPKQLQGVGYEKGKEVRKRLKFSRQGAIYRTFHSEARSGTEGERGPMRGVRPQGLGALVSAAGMSKAYMGSNGISLEPGFMNSSISTYGRRKLKQAMNPIKWMEGVKMGRRRADTMEFFESRPSMIKKLSRAGLWDTPESLSDEMTFVSKKYKKVDFEKADVHQRVSTVTLHGPWGPEEKPAFMRVTFEFPEDYPISAGPTCSFERTTSGISEDALKKLAEEVKIIIDHYKERKLGCLEAIITYLLGERRLEESIEPDEDLLLEEPVAAEEESSSDEEGLEAPQDLENSATENLGVKSAQANVPLPVACGASFAQNGRLVCFFPPKPEPKPLFNLDALRNPERTGRNHNPFQGFGRLVEESPHPKVRSPASSDDEGDRSSRGSWTTSSSSSASSEDADEIIHLPARFKPPSAWRAATLRWQKSSSHSSGGRAQVPLPSKPKSFISIHDMSDLLPAKRVLAEEYRIFGNGPTICMHNAEVARRHEEDDIAAIWDLCALILYNDVPLEILDQQHRKEPVLVLARRNVVRVKRKEAGLDWMWDEPPSVSNPKLTGRVKWGRHPLASAWLIPALFEYFETIADIQMLAMLACLFCEPAAREGVPNALMKLPLEDLPMAMKAPAFSLDYFPSSEVAWSLYQEIKPRNGAHTPVDSRATKSINQWERDYFNNKLGTYGSAGSSNGPWAGDVVPSDPITPYSTGNTPPRPSRLLTPYPSSAASLSTSPDAPPKASKRSASNLSSAFATISRPFSITVSSSPDDRTHLDSELSTSAPSGVTWGTNTVFSSGSTPSPEKRRRSSLRRRPSSTVDSAYDSEATNNASDSEDEPSTPIRGAAAAVTSPTVRVRLKNQHLFDDEAVASAPLLDLTHSERHAIYRELYAELLGVWGLGVARAEILKFNGLTSYWASDRYEVEQVNSLPPLVHRQQAKSGQSLITMATTTENGPTNEDRLTSPRLVLEQPSEATTGKSGLLAKANEDSKTTHRLNPNAKPFTPSINQSTAPTPDPLSPTTQRHEVQATTAYGALGTTNGNLPTTMMSAMSSRQPVSAEGTYNYHQLCMFCWQPTDGLFFYTCPTRAHVAHAGCLTGYERSTGRPLGQGEGLVCACPGYPPYMSVGISERRHVSFGAAQQPSLVAPQAHAQDSQVVESDTEVEYTTIRRSKHRLDRHNSSMY